MRFLSSILLLFATVSAFAAASNPTIVTRIGKGSPLTPQEADANWVNLSNHAVLQRVRVDTVLQDSGNLKTNIVGANELMLTALTRYFLIDQSTTPNQITVGVTNRPAGFALADIVGVPIQIKVAVTNSAGVFVDITNVLSGSSSAALKKTGNQDLVVGDLKQGQIITVTYDGTYFQLLSPSAKPIDAPVGIIGSGRMTKVKRNASTPASQIDITGDEFLLRDSNGRLYVTPSIAVTINASGSGANGSDAVISQATNSYHIYLIYNGTTVSGLLSASATSPTMPSGYTYKALVGKVYNEATGSWNFTGLVEYGQQALFTSTEYSLASSNTVLTVPHLLGSTPSQVYWVLVCKNPDLGFVAGDEIAATSAQGNNNRPGFSPGANSSSVIISGESATTRLIQRFSGTLTDITPNSWRLKCYARY